MVEGLCEVVCKGGEVALGFSFICTLVCYSHAFSYTPFDGAVLTTFL